MISEVDDLATHAVNANRYPSKGFELGMLSSDFDRVKMYHPPRARNAAR